MAIKSRAEVPHLCWNRKLRLSTVTAVRLGTGARRARVGCGSAVEVRWAQRPRATSGTAVRGDGQLGHVSAEVCRGTTLGLGPGLAR